MTRNLNLTQRGEHRNINTEPVRPVSSTSADQICSSSESSRWALLAGAKYPFPAVKRPSAGIEWEPNGEP